jgi:hypothetical protein
LDSRVSRMPPPRLHVAKHQPPHQAIKRNHPSQSLRSECRISKTRQEAAMSRKPSLATARRHQRHLANILSSSYSLLKQRPASLGSTSTVERVLHRSSGHFSRRSQSWSLATNRPVDYCAICGCGTEALKRSAICSSSVRSSFVARSCLSQYDLVVRSRCG